MCPHCRAFITTKDKVCPYCDTPVGPRAVEMRDVGDKIAGLLPAAQFVTSLILTINVGLYLVTAIAAVKSGRGSLFDIDVVTLSLYGATRPDRVLLAQEWWRLITAGFLHGGLMHILFNSWAMMDIGAHAEAVYGPRRLIFIYVSSTIGGFLASTFFTRSVSVGASAGLFGLIGAMIAVGVMHRSFEATAIKQFYIRWAVYGLLIGLLPFFRVDNGAHIGGLVTGFAAAWLSGLPKPWASGGEKVWTGIAGACVLLVAYSFFRMFFWMTSVVR